VEREGVDGMSSLETLERLVEVLRGVGVPESDEE